MITSSLTVQAGKKVNIPSGYYSDDIKVNALSLSSQTQATATAADIRSGKTAWVNGVKITGTA